MEITNEMIREDIQGFNERISDAREKLRALPKGRLPYSQHKKRERQRHEFKDEIRHVEMLIGYAIEGLGMELEEGASN